MNKVNKELLTYLLTHLSVINCRYSASAQQWRLVDDVCCL